MIPRISLALLLCVVAPAAAACTSPSDADPDPPSRYPERWRPQQHFSPEANWMNDPAGLVHYRGVYHLFYQHDPNFPLWIEMHWGHAVSTDLVHWEHRPIALYPDPTLGAAFTGSAVVDHDNTSGLCAGTPGDPSCLVALFTHSGGSDATQKQSVAWSDDEGESWQLYAGNPVLPNPGVTDFRDPKVFWYPPAGRWIMALAAGDAVRFYASPDLLDWTPLSTFAPPSAAGVTWECPDLFALPVDEGTGGSRWVLLVSLLDRGPSGASGTQYFVGDFDGTTFTAAPPEPRWVDHGPDFYAAQSWSDHPDGARVIAAWMSNWRYGQFVPTTAWRGALSIPRRLGLRQVLGEVLLVQHPIDTLEDLRSAELLHREGATLDGASDLLAGVRGTNLDLSVAIAVGDATEVGIRVHDDGAGHATVVGWHAATETVFVDRRDAGSPTVGAGFPGRYAAPVPLAAGELTLRVLVDTASVTVFAGDGRAAITAITFPPDGANGLAIYSAGGAALVRQVTVDRLRTIWPVP